MEDNKNRAVFRKFMDIQHLMHAAHRNKKAQCGPMGDTTHGKGRILALLKLKDGIATKDMAQIVGIRVSSLNETLAKLEHEGLVTRTPAEDDKRVMLVSLTDAGKQVQQPEKHFPDRVFADFNDEELTSLEANLDKMIANLETELGSDAKESLESMRQARKEFFEGEGPLHHREHRHGHHHSHDVGHRRGRCHDEHEGHGGPHQRTDDFRPDEEDMRFHDRGGCCGVGGHGPYRKTHHPGRGHWGEPHQHHRHNCR